MQAADQERNSWWERFLSANTRRPFNLCPNNGLLTLLSERASVEERGLSRALGFAR